MGLRRLSDRVTQRVTSSEPYVKKRRRLPGNADDAFDQRQLDQKYDQAGSVVHIQRRFRFGQFTLQSLAEVLPVPAVLMRLLTMRQG